MTFDTHLREVGCNAYAVSSLEHCAPVWTSSAESHLGLLDSIICSAERLCEGELCCLGLRMKLVPFASSIIFVSEQTSL